MCEGKARDVCDWQHQESQVRSLSQSASIAQVMNGTLTAQRMLGPRACFCRSRHGRWTAV